jgi:hypothetical protein
MVTTETNTANISLQAITTFENNDEIQVKWNTDTGTLSVENRILTLRFSNFNSTLTISLNKTALTNSTIS